MTLRYDLRELKDFQRGGVSSLRCRSVEKVICSLFITDLSKLEDDTVKHYVCLMGCNVNVCEEFPLDCIHIERIAGSKE